MRQKLPFLRQETPIHMWDYQRMLQVEHNQCNPIRKDTGKLSAEQIASYAKKLLHLDEVQKMRLQTAPEQSARNQSGSGPKDVFSVLVRLSFHAVMNEPLMAWWLMHICQMVFSIFSSSETALFPFTCGE
jgi:hypothetical protein